MSLTAETIENNFMLPLTSVLHGLKQQLKYCYSPLEKYEMLQEIEACEQAIADEFNQQGKQ